MKRFFSAAPLWQTAGLTLVRCALGGFLIYHGMEVFDENIMNRYFSWKQFDDSTGQIFAYAGKIGELIAGILFVLGLFTRAASLITIGIMCYIAFFLGKGIIWYDDQHPFLFVLLALVFFFYGPRKFQFR